MPRACTSVIVSITATKPYKQKCEFEELSNLGSFKSYLVSQNFGAKNTYFLVTKLNLKS